MDDRQRLPPLIVLLGPTAVGKTELSLRLCERFNGEIIGADSRQIYQKMTIGTAKPTPAELQRVPHHLIDICVVDEPLTLAAYQRLAYQTIAAIHQRGNLPFLVGGTALYLRAVVDGLRIPEVPPNPEVRAELENFLTEHGRDALFSRLAAADPATAAVIDGKNHRRVLRALEIVITTGRSKTELEGADPPPYRILQIGLDRPRERLYARIDQRVLQMVDAGLVAETERLLASGYDLHLPAMSSLGYREIHAYLQGESTLDEAIERIQIETHCFVRHQYTWFRRMTNVQWFNLEEDAYETHITAAIEQFLADGAQPMPA